MKFIFPQNYKFNNKFLGIIDYSTAIFDIVWTLFIFTILNIFTDNILIKIFIGISLCFPFILLSFVGFNDENILDVFSYLLKYIFRQKLFLYNK